MIDRGHLPDRAVARCARPGSTWTCWPRRSRCSRCRTGTSGCAATSTRASRTAIPGTYLNSFYELRPLPYAEAGYGYPESGQTLVNVTNGKLIRLLVDDEPFDVRYGTLRAPRAGARLARPACWNATWTGPRRPASGSGHRSPAGVVHPARGRGDRVRGRAARPAGPARRAVRAGRERGRSRRLPTTPASAAVARQPAAAGEQPRRRASTALVLVHRTTAQRAADGRRRWTTRSTARPVRDGHRRTRTTGPGPRSICELRARADSCAW